MKRLKLMSRFLRLWNGYVDVADTKAWIDKADVNKDGKIQLKDLLTFVIGKVSK